MQVTNHERNATANQTDKPRITRSLLSYVCCRDLQITGYLRGYKCKLLKANCHIHVFTEEKKQRMHRKSNEKAYDDLKM